MALPCLPPPFPPCIKPVPVHDPWASHALPHRNASLVHGHRLFFFISTVLLYVQIYNYFSSSRSVSDTESDLEFLLVSTLGASFTAAIVLYG